MKLIEYLPDYYLKNKTMCLLQEILEKQKQKLEELLGSEFAQIFPTLATDELKRWEKILAIESDTRIDLISRRERICAKLIGNETTTKDTIKNIVKAFTNGSVEIIEADKYLFKIKFIDIIGRPKNMDKVRETIEEIKPAHLAYEFIFLYNANEILKKFTHEQLKKYKHLSLRNEVLNG